MQQKNGTKDGYSHENPIKFLTNSVESSHCDYSDAHILVTGNITATRTIAVSAGSPVDTQSQRNQGFTAPTQVASKTCAPFKKYRTEINETFVDEADFIDITMPMYDLIEYSDNYSDTSGNLWGFKREEVANNANLANNNVPSFKYKANLIGNTEANGIKKGVKIAVPLKYLSNFWRSLEMPFINSKVELSLGRIEECVLTTAEIGANAHATGADSATFKITDAKRYVPVVLLSTEDSVKASKLLSGGFKRPVYWNKYMVIGNIVAKIAVANTKKYIRERLDASYQGVKR